MSIGKIITKGVSAAAKTVKSECKLTQSAGENLFGKTSSILSAQPAKAVTASGIKAQMQFQDFSVLLKNNSKYSKLSDETKKLIDKFCNIKKKTAAKSSNPQKQYGISVYNVKELIRHCDDEKAIQILMKNENLYNSYTKNIKPLRTALKNAESIAEFDLRDKIILNLAVMKAINPKNCRTLEISKGFSEIKAGRLSICYLKDLKPTDIVDGDFFYKLFDDIEKAANQRLVNSGLDVEAVNKYFKMQDKKVCLYPGFVNGFISSLEKIDNPEVANAILKRFEKGFDDASFPEFFDADFRKIINAAALEPEIASKAIQVSMSNPHFIYSLMKKMKDKNIYKISDDLFESYLKAEKAYPDCFYPPTISGINDFLLLKGTDEKLVSQILKNAGTITKNTNRNGIDKIFENAAPSNIEFLKTCIKKGSMTSEELFKYKILRLEKGQLPDEEILKLYNEIYKPLYDVLGTDEKYLAGIITELKLTNPEQFAKYKESKILDLVIERKIDPRILKNSELLGVFVRQHSLSSILENPEAEILPEIHADIQKLLKGESLIKKFDTTKDILKKTLAGDVVSVNGKMYINNNGKLEHWNMTEEKFNELFPLVDRFTTIQGLDDCYFISTLNSMYRNPHTRGAYYKMFEQKGNDICVTIPAYKDYKGEVRFPNGEIPTIDTNANAAKNVQMLERAYERTALRTLKGVPTGKDPLTTEDYDYLHKRIMSGTFVDAMKELMPSQPVKDICYKDEKKVCEALKNYGNNPKFIIGESLRSGSKGHARSVVSYSDKKGVTVIDPSDPGKQFFIPLKEFLNKLCGITIAWIE